MAPWWVPMSDQKVIRPSISPDESWLVTRKCLEPLWSPNELTGITLGPWWIPMSDQEEPVTLSSPHECPWVSISSDEPCESIWAPMGHGEWPGNVYMDQSETQMSDHGLPSDPWRVPSASNPMMPMANGLTMRLNGDQEVPMAPNESWRALMSPDEWPGSS